MTTPTFITNAVEALKANSPQILTAVGVSGVVTTAYLTGKASIEAHKIIEANKEHTVIEDRKERLREYVRQTWKLYIPAGVSGGATIACIVGVSRVSARRTAAVTAAYSLSERAFHEYREKVVEQIGEGKERKIRDEIAQDRVTNKPPGSTEVIIVGSGHVLCCELRTHRYFRSDMETLRRAQNDINGKIVNELYVTLDEFYDAIGLPHTSTSDNEGWDSDKLMELQFSTVISEDGEPCLAFEYNYVKPL